MVILLILIFERNAVGPEVKLTLKMIDLEGLSQHTQQKLVAWGWELMGMQHHSRQQHGGVRMTKNKMGISTFQGRAAWPDAILGSGIHPTMCLSPSSLEGKPDTKTFLESVIPGIKDDVQGNKAEKGQSQNQNALLSRPLRKVNGCLIYWNV